MNQDDAFEVDLIDIADEGNRSEEVFNWDGIKQEVLP